MEICFVSAFYCDYLFSIRAFSLLQYIGTRMYHLMIGISSRELLSVGFTCVAQGGT